jgi:hypothetical protein
MTIPYLTRLHQQELSSAEMAMAIDLRCKVSGSAVHGLVC